MAILDKAYASRNEPILDIKAGKSSSEFGNRADGEILIESFIDAWDRKDIEGVFAHCSPDIIYGNGPFKDIVGLEALRDYFEPVLKAAEKIEFRVSALVAAGKMVALERVDYITLAEKTYTVAVAGILTFDGKGKICVWRDYFDVQSWYDQGGAPLESAADRISD